jgi:hypothetical protein
VTFQVEKWREFYPEARPLMRAHWEEIALDRDVIPLSMNEERYQALADAGLLHVLAAREDAELAGYYVAIVMPHVHYQNAGLMAFTDIYFLAPRFRQGTNGVQLFVEAEESLRALGVVKAYLSCKVQHDVSPIFEALGWKLSDKNFTKVLTR